MQKKRVVVLLSGGLDSTVLATFAARAGILAGAAFVDYGQPAATQERTAASRWCALNRTPFYAIPVNMSGLPNMQAGVGAQGPRVVPGRNLILLSLAANLAAQLGAREVWYGATASDAADYNDCRPEFVAALSKALQLDTGGTVKAPLAGMTRAEVRALAEALEIARRDTWSCYQPTEEGRACGTCNSCRQDAA